MTDNNPSRPFCFLVQFWGKRYRDYFVDLCLPSLLADQNLPLLDAQDGHAFLIATPQEDWEAIKQLPIMDKLRKFVTPVLVETAAPAEKSYEANLRHQSFSLKRLVEIAYERRAYGCAVWPDTMLSNGFVAAMLRWVRAGYQIVLLPTLRQSEEHVLSDLRELKLLPSEGHASRTAQALPLAPRLVADLSVRYLHPELQSMQEGHPNQPLHPPYRYWRVPNRRGFILHVFFATPVLIDFAAVPRDHATALDHGNWELAYVRQNFSDPDKLYVVADFDECGMISVTPESVNYASGKLTYRFGSHWAPTFALLCNLRASIANYTRVQQDVVRRELFKVSVRWHADDVDEAWLQEEGRIDAIINRSAADYFERGRKSPSRISVDLRYLLFDVVNELQANGSIIRAKIDRLAGTFAKKIKVIPRSAA